MDFQSHVWALHCEGLSPTQIAERLNVDTQTVRAQIVRCWRADWTTKRRHDPDEKEGKRWEYSLIG